MAKFKIGDRVRVLPRNKSLPFSCHGARDGEVFTVRDVRGENGDNLDTEVWAFYEHEVELALTLEPGNHYRTRSGKPTGRVTKGDTGFEAVVDGRVRIFDAAGGAVHGDDDIVEAWVPKVGERVTEMDGNHHDFVGHWRDYWENSQGPLVDNTFVVISVDAEWISYSNREGGGGPSCTVKFLQPAPVAQQPAALKIEAGRYYKTRDGRKVGPLKTHGGSGLIVVFGDGRVWELDGKARKACVSMSPYDDLIAEWHEATNVGAQVDTLAEEYGSPKAAAKKAATPKFKVGDRVRLVVDDGNAVKVGATGVVGPRAEFGMFVDIIWDQTELRNHQMHGGHFKSSFEHADTPTVATTAIVALIENGQPKPAAVPHVHATQAAATKEANRLAGVHKGKQFGVFVLASTAEETAPTYGYQWQRLAAGGKKIDAIKELRAVTGMQLKPAKDVVEHFLDYPYGQAA